MTATIRRTQVVAGEVITVRSSDPFALYGFQTYLVTDDVCSHVRHFASEAAALHHHDNLVRVANRQKGEAAP